jgi:mannose/cellobiose epimerase-like protein (N-acyl-D-glucosamine 2-epimerase family)
MHMTGEVRNYLGACERLISVMMSRQLTDEEARMIEFYCKELLVKIASLLLKS